ncbi:hypothetical protein AB431_20080 [Mycobacterium sp. EPa45]|nr:hypothetical protein AB431_20080 [Mycobacterium sp. EPa45]
MSPADRDSGGDWLTCKAIAASSNWAACAVIRPMSPGRLSRPRTAMTATCSPTLIASATRSEESVCRRVRFWAPSSKFNSNPAVSSRSQSMNFPSAIAAPMRSDTQSLSRS